MKIPFEPEYRDRFYQLLDEVFNSNYWSDGPVLRKFEEKFEEFTGLPSRGISSGGTGLLSILDYLDVRGKDVLVPANTFWATAQSAKLAGGNLVYVDCNREDLCMSVEDLKRKVTPNTKVVIVVHIGGYIAFQIEEIAAFCKEKGIALVEDCAHVHGGTWNGKTGGHFGFAGAYSFYATKTMPTGDGGMVVSRDKTFLDWLEKYCWWDWNRISSNPFTTQKKLFIEKQEQSAIIIQKQWDICRYNPEYNICKNILTREFELLGI